MGGLSSKQAARQNPYAGRSTGQEKSFHLRQEVQRDVSEVLTAPQATEKQAVEKESPRLSEGYASVSDDDSTMGYLGTGGVHPRNLEHLELLRCDKHALICGCSHKYNAICAGLLVAVSLRMNIEQFARSFGHRLLSQLLSTTEQVSELCSLLRRAGSFIVGKTVEVLDSLGSSVAKLNSSGATTKSNELSILSFEVANTIVKGSNLMQSLSTRSIRQLKETVLTAESVQQLISTDMDELLRIGAADKREELKVFSGEVVRFGNRCKDPQWHNLDPFFENRSRDRTPQKQLREIAESVMLQLMTLVQLTAELYQGLHTLDKLEQDYQFKRLEELRYNAGQRGDKDNSLNILAGELKSQRKLVKNLKKKSLWSRSMEEVMEKLVDIVLYLNQEINYTFGNPGETETAEGTISSQQKLGPAGLALHYANIILQIDSIVARSGSVPQISRDTLYQNLPPNVKDSLRSKLQSFHVEKELTVTEIKDEMEKTLHWLVPVATNTAKAHHGFGWVGEWGSAGSEVNRLTVVPINVMQIETLHHANKQKTDAYILNLLVWLNYLVSRSKSSSNEGVTKRPSLRFPAASPSKASNQKPVLKEADTLPTLHGANTCEENNAEKLDRVKERLSSDDKFVHLVEK